MLFRTFSEVIEKLLSESLWPKDADVRNPRFQNVFNLFITPHPKNNYQRSVRQLLMDFLSRKDSPPLEIIRTALIHDDLHLDVLIFRKPDISTALQAAIEALRYTLETGLCQLEIHDFVQGVALQNTRFNLLPNQIPEPPEMNDPVGFHRHHDGDMGFILEQGLLLFPNGLQYPVQEPVIKGHGFIDLDEER